VGTCPIQRWDIKEVAQERGTVMPHTWEGAGYRGRGICNTTWNFIEEDNDFLQFSSKQSLDISLHSYYGTTSAVNVFSLSMVLRYF
jgi:hypothetical protein